MGAGNGLAVAFDFKVLPPTDKYGGYPVEMAGAAFGDPAKTVWKFSTGDSVTVSPNTTYVFDQPGIYTVCFTASDPVTQQSIEQCQEIEIIDTGFENELSVFTKFDVFPNPVTGPATVSYELPEMSATRISVYDMIGKEHAVILNEDRGAGSYTLEWDTSDFRPGVYLLKLQTSYAVKIKRITITR